jgi:hypothetical protein
MAEGFDTDAFVERIAQALTQAGYGKVAPGSDEPSRSVSSQAAGRDGWLPIDEKAKNLKRVDLFGSYPGRNPKGKRIPDCYWHKKAGVWRCDHCDRDGFRLLRSNFEITHYRALPPCTGGEVNGCR